MNQKIYIFFVKNPYEYPKTEKKMKKAVTKKLKAKNFKFFLKL